MVILYTQTRGAWAAGGTSRVTHGAGNVPWLFQGLFPAL